MTDLPKKPRVWIDGCFDFAHHGHANAVLQAKQLASSLVVGVHSDEEIEANKGPPVMKLDERVMTVQSFKWVDEVVPHAPYVTQLEVMDEHKCEWVVHGDDITTDADGNDTYRLVKAAGRFKEVKRTKNISTTDLVGRMLLFTKSHFLPDASLLNPEYLDMISSFSTASDGVSPRNSVWFYEEPSSRLIVKGILPNDRPVIYVDGGFDLLSSGHIAFLQLVRKMEPNAYILAGLHSDRVINSEKGFNYPIMNIFERSLCLLACRYIDGLLIAAPYAPPLDLGIGYPIKTVYHGTSAVRGNPYAAYREVNMYKETPAHAFEDVNAKAVVDRILTSRSVFEQRQLKKMGKSEREAYLKAQHKNGN